MAAPTITPHNTDILTYSRVMTFLTCRFAHFIQYVHGIRTTEDSRAIRIGHTFHQAVSNWNKGCSRDFVVDAIIQGYNDAIPERICGDADASLGWLYEAHTVAAMFAAYADYYHDDDRNAIRYVEQTYYSPILNPATAAPTPNYKLASKIDAIYNDGVRDLIRETKTTGEPIGPDSKFWRRKIVDPQTEIYAINARANGLVIDGIFYDVVHRPALRPNPIPLTDTDGKKIVLNIHTGERVMLASGKGPKQSVTDSSTERLETRNMEPTEYFDRLYHDMLARPEFYFARRESPIMHDRMQECAAMLWDAQHDIRHAERKGHHFKNPRACDFCAFTALCHTRLDLDGDLPPGFERVADLHPELNY